MSLLVIRRSAGGAAACDELEPRVFEQVHRQGFARPHRLDWGNGAAWWYPTPGARRSTGALWRQGDRFAACVGSFHWKGLTGEAVLQRLLACGTRPSQWPLDELSGSFAMLMGGPDGVWLFNDALGLQKLFACSGSPWLSTSLMVCRATLRNPGADRLRAQEYVLTGAAHSTRLPVQGLELLDPTAALRLDAEGSLPLHPPRRLLLPARSEAFDETVSTLASALSEEFAGLAAGFGPDIGMALSGGFDSRLLLAGLRQAGVTPSLFVYGRPQDADVGIASAVARRIGLPIECIDKSVLTAGLPPLSSAQLRANYAFFDGLPVDGVFDRGADQATRLRQFEGGRLNLNGGGGEIFRNFFYLPDRPYTAAQVVAAFYSAWLDEVFDSLEDRNRFFEAFQDQVLQALGRDAGRAAERHRPLPRAEVELVYSLVRLRFWMGQNNSLAVRSGPFQTPLVTPRLVSFAAAVPMATKEFGRLEAAVIRRLDPEVARGPSAYGFDFSEGPGWRHRFNSRLTLHRPIPLRHQSVRVQKALGRLRSVQAPAEWCDALGQEPCTDWLNPQALLGADQMNRLLTLQGLLRDDVCGVA